VVITTDQPRSSASDGDFTPLVFAQKGRNSAESLYKKTSRKNAEFLYGFMMPQFFNIKKKDFFLR
jgi:hypothetical protein